MVGSPVTLVDIQLPRLAGTREAARELIQRSGVAHGGETAVLLSARLLTTGTISFADEVVKLLQEAGVNEVVLAGAPQRFEHLVKTAAARRGLSGLRLASPDDILAV